MPEAHGDAAHQADMRKLPKLKFALLLFPNVTALDLVGPQLLMSTMMNTEVHLAAKTRDPVMADSGFAIVPTTDFASCPRDVDVFCVPGGPRGTSQAMADPETIRFVAEMGSKARYVSSVCTGSMILGAAGLLKGYRAASHWATRDILPEFGAIPVDARVVEDRNRITGGGITAGLDFGLLLAQRLRGEETARLQALILEYDPHPPFDAGSPTKAKRETLELAQSLLKPDAAKIRDLAKRSIGAAG
jgi:cyclohexyl-isocyanide hydratase